MASCRSFERLRSSGSILPVFADLSTLSAALWIVAAVLGSGNWAAAQAPPASSATTNYGTAIDAALEEYRSGNFAEARALFLQADAISPNARTARGVGMAEFELGRYVEAIGWFEQALASRERALTDALRAETETLLARARGFVARVALTLDPAATKLKLDGREKELKSQQSLLLSVGSHRLEFFAPGYVSEFQTLDVNGGEALTRSIALRAVAPEPVVAAPALAAAEPTGEVHDASAWYASPLLWTGVGVVVAGAVVGIALAVSGGGSAPSYDGGSTGRVLRAGAQ